MKSGIHKTCLHIFGFSASSATLGSNFCSIGLSQKLCSIFWLHGRCYMFSKKHIMLIRSSTNYKDIIPLVSGSILWICTCHWIKKYRAIFITCILKKKIRVFAIRSEKEKEIKVTLKIYHQNISLKHWVAEQMLNGEWKALVASDGPSITSCVALDTILNFCASQFSQL